MSAAQPLPPGAAVTFTLPLQVTVQLGGAAPATPLPAAAGPAPAAGLAEAVSIDPDYGHREGYDPEFLGDGPLAVPLPRLTAAQQADAARNRTAGPRDDPFELKYHHYSVVLNGRRRLAFFTAVNIDGRSHWPLERETDRWYFDPRVGREHQVGDELYDANPFDKGHLVRRLDPAWGRTEGLAKVANDDTFHFTNCSPQHEQFNRGKQLWAGLEDYLLDRATGERRRLTVFTGPVFAADDPVYRGVAIPRQFWKVAVLARPDRRPAALGFVVSQADLIRPVVAEEAARDVARTYQVPVARVEELTGLDFGPLRGLDAGGVAQFGAEAAAGRELNALEDVRLPGAPAPAGPTAFAAMAEAAAAPGGTDTVPGTDLRYYLLAFDEQNHERADHPAGLVSRLIRTAVGRDPVTDVFLFSHGWLGDVPSARRHYAGWIGTMAAHQADRDRARRVRPGFQPLLIGLHWPSQPWGDEHLGAEAFAPGGDAAAGLVEIYARRLGDTPEIRARLRDVAGRLAAAAADRLPPDLADAYRALDRAVGLGAAGPAAAPGADREGFDPDAVYRDALTDRTGPVNFGLFDRDTLLAPLRTLSFWKMKDRARQVGEEAINPLLVQLQEATAGRDVRFHLIGHSFGCIVASAAVTGRPGAVPLPRPVASLTLLQGALSLWSFCADIPYSPGRPGYFHRLFAEGRVAGPVVTTRSRWDTAVGTWYPRGAQVAGQVAFLTGQRPRYGAVGAFGIQGSGLTILDQPMLPADAAYQFQGKRAYNLEASGIIRTGGGTSGAHSDLLHPEVAHAVWSASLATASNPP